MAKLQVRINQLNRDAVDDKQAADGLLAELNKKRALGKSIIQGLVSTSDCMGLYFCHYAYAYVPMPSMPIICYAINSYHPTNNINFNNCYIK